MAGRPENYSSVSVRSFGNLMSTEMFQKFNCMIFTADVPFDSIVNRKEILDYSGNTVNIQPAVMHYKAITDTGGIFCVPITYEIPTFDAIRDGLSRKELLRKNEELFQSPVFALRFSREAFAYSYNYDLFSADASVSMHYRAFAAFEPLKITISRKENASEVAAMWNCTVPITYKNNVGNMEGVRVIPARHLYSSTAEKLQVVVLNDGILIIPEFTLYKLNYEIPEGEDTILLTTVFASGEDLNIHKFKEDCEKSIKFVDTTTRLAATGSTELKLCTGSTELKATGRIFQLFKEIYFDS